MMIIERSEAKRLPGDQNRAVVFSVERGETYLEQEVANDIPLSANGTLFSSTGGHSRINSQQTLANRETDRVGSDMSLLHAIAMNPQQFLSSHWIAKPEQVSGRLISACYQQEASSSTRGDLTRCFPAGNHSLRARSTEISAASNRLAWSLSDDAWLRFVDHDETRQYCTDDFSNNVSMTHNDHTEMRNLKTLHATLEFALQFCEQFNSQQVSEDNESSVPTVTLTTPHAAPPSLARRESNSSRICAVRAGHYEVHPFQRNTQEDGPIIHHGYISRWNCHTEPNRINDSRSKSESQEKQ